MTSSPPDLPPGLPIRPCTIPAHQIRSLAAAHPLEYTRVVSVVSEPGGTRIIQEVKSEVFDLLHTDYGPLRFFISEIRRGIASWSIPFATYSTTLTEEWYDHLMAHNGIEEAGVARLTPSDLRRPSIWLASLGPTGPGVNVIDGAHRLVRRWRLGLPSCRFILVSLPDLATRGLLVRGHDAFPSPSANPQEPCI